MKDFSQVLQERAAAREAEKKAQRIARIKRYDKNRRERQRQHHEWELREAPDEEQIQRMCKEIRGDATRVEHYDQPKLHRCDSLTHDPRRELRNRQPDESDYVGSIWNGQRVIQCVSETHAKVLIDLGF